MVTQTIEHHISRHFTSGRYLLPAIFLFVFIDYTLGVLPASPGLSAALPVLQMAWFLLLLWTLITNRRPELDYILAMFCLLYVLQGVNEGVSKFPDWLNSTLLIAHILWVIWMIRYMVASYIIGTRASQSRTTDV